VNTGAYLLMYAFAILLTWPKTLSMVACLCRACMGDNSTGWVIICTYDIRAFLFLAMKLGYSK
jgi:hypothetical protein